MWLTEEKRKGGESSAHLIFLLKHDSAVCTRFCGQVAAEAFAQEHLSRVLEEEQHASEAVTKIESGALMACCIPSSGSSDR